NLEVFVKMIGKTDGELKLAMEDPQPMTRLLAIQIVAMKAAPLEKDLIGLVADEEPLVAQSARAVLVQMNQGIDFGSGYLVPKEEVNKARANWEDWLTRRKEKGVREATFVRQGLERLAPKDQDTWLAVLREDKTEVLPLALALAIPDLEEKVQEKTRRT